MTIYYALIILLLLFSLLFHGEKRNSNKYITIAIVLLFCVHGMRDAKSIGHDSSSSYLHLYESIEEAKWSNLPDLSEWAHAEKQEDGSGHDRNIGIQWLMKAVSDLTDGDYQAFAMVVSCFTLLSLAHFVKKYSPSPVQSFLLWMGLLFFTFTMSGLKQTIAMSLVILAFDGIYERKILNFLFFVIVASIFHFPALVFLPAYWIANMRLGKTYLIFLTVLFFVTYLFRDQLVDWMTDTYETEIINNSGMRFLANKVVVMLIIIIAAIVVRPPHSDDGLYCSLLMLVGVSAVIQTFASYNNTFERLADYYFQFSVAFIPMIFEPVKTKRRHLSERELSLVRNIGPYLFCAFAIWRFLNAVSNDSAFNPYQFYFQVEEAEETLSAWLNLL